jgi:hypothetical protein
VVGYWNSSSVSPDKSDIKLLRLEDVEEALLKGIIDDQDVEPF